MNHPARIPSNELRDTTKHDTSSVMSSQACQTAPPAPFFRTPTSHSVTPPRPGPVGPAETPSDLPQRPAIVDTTGTSTANPVSPPHRPEPRTDPTPSHIPSAINIAEHSQMELLTMLSSLLTKITTSNDSLHSGANSTNTPKAGSPLLAFHARNIPSISIQSYLSRILKYCPMSSDIFLSLLVYFDRMSKPPRADDPQALRCQTFTSTQQLMGDEHHPFSIDSYNVHRLVITGIVVASKFCSDVFYTNSRYAKVCCTTSACRNLKTNHDRSEDCLYQNSII